jgi:AcrR family transcriptional regulator
VPETQRRMQAEATRGQLMASARVVFADRGYQGATVKAITQGADTAHGTFYLYFKNKEQAFVEVITEVLDELYLHSISPLVDGQVDWHPDRPRERIAGFLGVAARQGRLWRAILEGALASPQVEAHWMLQRRAFHLAVADRFRALQDTGVLRAFDPVVASLALTSMLEWVAFSSIAFDDPGVLDPSSPMADVLADLWMRAVEAR